MLKSAMATRASSLPELEWDYKIFNQLLPSAVFTFLWTTLTVDYLFNPSVASRIACDTTYVVKKKSDAPKDIKLYDKGVEVLHLQSGEGVVQYLGNFNGLYTKISEE